MDKSCQDMAIKGRPNWYRSSWVRSSRNRSSLYKLSWDNSSQDRTSQERSSQVGTGQVKAGQVKSSWDKSNQLRTGQVNLGKVKSDRSIFLVSKFLLCNIFLTQDLFRKTFIWESSVALLSPTCFHLLLNQSLYHSGIIRSNHE